jgi:hypothetical protein
MTEQILHWNEQWMGAPIGVVVWVFAIVLGYILKIAEFYPNKRIPIAIVGFTSVVFPVLQVCSDAINKTEHAFARIPFYVITGFIVGGAAWGTHRLVLQHIEDKIPFLKGWISENDTPAQ